MAKEKNKPEAPQVLEGELQARLIKLREDAGYSTSQMADVLCLSEEVIVNLENEAFELLAEPPYVRGYLRNYAKLGEDDPSELINRYESLRGADASELDYQIKSSSQIEISSRKRISPVMSQLILLAILLAGIGLLTMIPGVSNWFQKTWDNLSNQLQPSSETTNNPLLTGTMPVPIPLPENNESFENTDNVAIETPEQASDTENTLQDKPKSTEPDNTKSTAEANSTTPEKATDKPTEENDNKQTVENSSGLISIKLIFNKDVWLRIKNKDNKTVFEGLNKTGSTKSLELDKPLSFRVGNAQGLSLFVDDKAVDISTYINGSIANFTLE